MQSAVNTNILAYIAILRKSILSSSTILKLCNIIFASVPAQSKMTATLRHYLHSPIIPNIIKIRDENRIFKLNSRKNTR